MPEMQGTHVPVELIKLHNWLTPN